MTDIDLFAGAFATITKRADGRYFLQIWEIVNEGGVGDEVLEFEAISPSEDFARGMAYGYAIIWHNLTRHGGARLYYRDGKLEYDV